MLPVPAMTDRAELARWRSLWSEGAHGALLNEIGQAMKSGELPAEGYGLGALACIALERFDEAVKAATNGVALAPREAWLYGALAEAYRGLARGAGSAEAAALPGAAAALPAGDWAKAIAAADQAVRLAPSEPAWHALGARLRRESGFAAEALQVAERGLQRHPQSAHLLVERGLARGAESSAPGNSTPSESGAGATPGAQPTSRVPDSGALADLRQAQALTPTDPWPFEAEGLLHSRTGRPTEAAAAYRRALRLAAPGPAREAIEDHLARVITPSGLLRPLLLAARVTVIGWVVILFGYYIFFRLLQIGWKLAPAFKPFGQGLLLATAIGGALLVVAGHLTRLLLRQGRS